MTLLVLLMITNLIICDCLHEVLLLSLLEYFEEGVIDKLEQEPLEEMPIKATRAYDSIAKVE